jgi:hypothetical protein
VEFKIMNNSVQNVVVVSCDCKLVSSIPEVSDVDVLIQLSSGDEYLYTVSRDNDTGVVLDPSEDLVRFAASGTDDYSEVRGAVPELVSAKFAEVRDEAIALMPVLAT